MSTSAPAIGPPAFMVAWAVQICASALSHERRLLCVLCLGRGPQQEQPRRHPAGAAVGRHLSSAYGERERGAERCMRGASVQQIPCLHQRGPLALDVTLARLLEPLVERLALLLSLAEAVWDARTLSILAARLDEFAADVEGGLDRQGRKRCLGHGDRGRLRRQREGVVGQKLAVVEHSGGRRGGASGACCCC